LVWIAISLLSPGAIAASAYTIWAEELNLNGHNLLCDSFHSADTNLNTNGHYDPAKAVDRAYLGLAKGIFSSSGVGNAQIWGYLDTQVPFTLDIGPTSSIGSAAWHLSGNTGIEEGHLTTNFIAQMPDVIAPFGNQIPLSGTVNGVAYKYILDSSVVYYLPELVLSGNDKMLVLADTKLHVPGNVKVSGNGSIQIEPSAVLQLFVGGEDANIGGNGIVNLGGVSGFLYAGLAGNTSLTLKVGMMRGLIYAPRTTCAITSPGGNVAELEGGIYARTVSLFTDFKLHFDEAVNPSAR